MTDFLSARKGYQWENNIKRGLVRAKLCSGDINCIDLVLCSVNISFSGKGDETSETTTPKPPPHHLIHRRVNTPIISIFFLRVIF
jgi:hypothetical protein